MITRDQNKFHPLLLRKNEKNKNLGKKRENKNKREKFISDIRFQLLTLLLYTMAERNSSH